MIVKVMASARIPAGCREVTVALDGGFRPATPGAIELVYRRPRMGPDGRMCDLEEVFGGEPFLLVIPEPIGYIEEKSMSQIPSRQNCLLNGLLFIRENPDYELRYNSAHVIAVPKTTPEIPGFLGLPAYGFTYFRSAFGNKVPESLMSDLQKACTPE